MDRTLIVNFKNYPEVLGQGSQRLAAAAAGAGGKTRVEVILAPPTPMLGSVANSSKLQVFAQSVGSESGDKTTGAILPESVKASGASGTLLNHSESRRKLTEIRSLVPRLRGLSLAVCLCARTPSEAALLSRLKPDYLAIEPPELVGTGIAVSRAKPELVTKTVEEVRDAGYRGKILCGAGIVTSKDVSQAIVLGTQGVLVSSSVVKAKDWAAKLDELAGALD